MNDKIYRLILIVFLLIPGFVKAQKTGEKIDIKISSEIQKSGVVGEVFKYEVTLLSNSPDVSNVRITKNPVFPEGMKVIKGVTGNNDLRKREEKGKTSYARTILRYYLIPDKAGKFTIEPGSFVAFIPHERIIYNGFWGNQRMVEYEEKALNCNSSQFKVNELPVNKDSSPFSGCVGEFTIEGWFPPGNIYVGSDAYAVFTIGGFGSLSDIKLPNLNKLFSNGCHLKEVEQNEEQQQRNGRLYSEVTLTCKFVPQLEDFEISPLCLLFFNPETKRYEKVCSESLHWMSQPSNKENKRTLKEAIEI